MEITDIETIQKQIPELSLTEGLGYCGENFEMYRIVLEEYCNGEKSTELQLFLENRDIVNYKMKAHALKGTSRMIGAIHLGKQAELLEFAAKCNNWVAIETRHTQVLEEYNVLIEKIKEYILEKY